MQAWSWGLTEINPTKILFSPISELSESTT